jgi:hypothetical protein
MTMRFSPITRRVYLAPAAGLVLVTAVSACSHSTENPQDQQGSFSAAPSSVRPSAPSAPGLTPAASTSATGGADGSVSQIKSNWNTFFSSATSGSERVQLLQNGSEFASSIKAFSSSPLAAAVITKFDSVTLSSASQAKVQYDLSTEGTTVVTHATGTSVLQDGTWKVGDDVFCGLLNQAKKSGLSVTVPAACSSAG